LNIEKSLEQLLKILIQLKEENEDITIIVEGENDIKALRKININGLIITINLGISIINFCDKIAEKYQNIIILTDWDKKGGYLCHTIRKNLEGRVNCNTRYRELIAKNSMIKTIEGLPSWLETMKNKI